MINPITKEDIYSRNEHYRLFKESPFIFKSKLLEYFIKAMFYYDGENTTVRFYKPISGNNFFIEYYHEHEYWRLMCNFDKGGQVFYEFNERNKSILRFFWKYFRCLIVVFVVKHLI